LFCGGTVDNASYQCIHLLRTSPAPSAVPSAACHLGAAATRRDASKTRQIYHQYNCPGHAFHPASIKTLMCLGPSAMQALLISVAACTCSKVPISAWLSLVAGKMPVFSRLALACKLPAWARAISGTLPRRASTMLSKCCSLSSVLRPFGACRVLASCWCCFPAHGVACEVFHVSLPSHWCGTRSASLVQGSRCCGTLHWPGAVAHEQMCFPACLLKRSA
jgi:hypothetical protein